ncbi:MAG: serine/threonine protein kinase [Lachnospiraceae bacterium]|nr:serine/threonine protein kinase [Lachnospiraceae bacterium]
MLPVELLNKYNVLQLLHHGIGGKIWLAEHKGLSCKRVLKAINKSHPQHDMLAREAGMLQQCQHPSIPIIYDILEFDTETYIVEEFVSGESLKQYILRTGSLSVTSLLEISVQLCEILRFLHDPARQILYLDLKPENILISNHRVKLIDFGSAIYRNQQEKERFIFGTPGYCAPEMKQNGPLSERTDLYCFGRCMEYMMNHSAEVPKGYRGIVEKCLRTNGKEYASAEQIAADLENLHRKKGREKTREWWYAVTGVLDEQDGSMAALQLAVYLRHRYRKPVLYLDCSESSQMEHLERSGKTMKNGGEQSSFVFERNGITVVKRVEPQEAGGWRGRGYAYVVCCFGKQYAGLSGCSFERYFCCGAVTEFTLDCWNEFFCRIKQEKRTGLMLTGGDELLAQKEFGQRCVIQKVPLYIRPFQHKKTFNRPFQRLLKTK